MWSLHFSTAEGSTNFRNLFLVHKKKNFFLFRTVPDLLFEGTGKAVASSLHVGSEVLEVKTNTNTKNSNTRSEFSQVTSSMCSIAIAKLLQQLKNGNNKPRDVMSKGLLVFMKKVMYLRTYLHVQSFQYLMEWQMPWKRQIKYKLRT